jgi:hypothetical protein
VDGRPVPVASVSSQAEADVVAGLLRASGIKAGVLADDAGGQDPQLQLDGVRVFVAPADAAAARQVLADAQAQAADTEPGDTEPGDTEQGD